jgi:hypothetical protein
MESIGGRTFSRFFREVGEIEGQENLKELLPSFIIRNNRVGVLSPIVSLVT